MSGPSQAEGQAMSVARWQSEALIAELQAQGIVDAQVLSAIARVPRDLFVPPEAAEQAYRNIALAIDCGQTISQPVIVAFMTEALEIRYWHRVLEIGTGSGYQAAILSQLCRQVCTIERYKSLHDSAVGRFRRLRLNNISARWGDGYDGWPEGDLFDRIIVTAAAPEVPQRLIEQLQPDGVMVLPLGDKTECQFIHRIRRTAGGSISERLLPVRFVPMRHGQVS